MCRNFTEKRNWFIRLLKRCMPHYFPNHCYMLCHLFCLYFEYGKMCLNPITRVYNISAEPIVLKLIELFQTFNALLHTNTKKSRNLFTNM